jgi:hypothetical protein
VTTPGLASGISGVILGEETLRARVSTGESFPAALRGRGMLAGPLHSRTGPGPRLTGPAPGRGIAG